jgi:hypothetical protein
MEKLEGKEMAVILHHLLGKKTSQLALESQISKLQRQLLEQVNYCCI